MEIDNANVIKPYNLESMVCIHKQTNGSRQKNPEMDSITYANYWRKEMDF